MTDQSIISAKINIPRLRSDVMIRKRIIDMLNEGLTRPSALILISAPAGFGKTTLLAPWLRKSNHRRAWLSLEPEDDSFPRFVMYLIASLQKVDPAIGQTVENILDRAGEISSQIDAIISSLINDLSKFKLPVTLVLEDYHCIKSSDIHKLVEEIIEHVHSLHLVITTRHDPPLPLPRWRARDQLIELRTHDLQFTFHETTEFLKRVMRLELSRDDIHVLEGQTEGWAAGLQLAALYIRNQKKYSWRSGENRLIGDYLLTEVYNQLSPSRREFLLQTSLVNRLSASLCNAMTQRSDSHALLDEFEADDLFIISLDDNGEWFRYHHLFTEFLRKRLLADCPENTVQDLHKRASHWFGKNDYILEAIQHALAGRDYEYATCLIGPQSEQWMRHGEISTILKYLDRLPKELVWDRWELCLWYGWSYAVTGELNSAEQWASRLETLITPLIQQVTNHESSTVPIDLQHAYIQVLGIRSAIARQEKDFVTAIVLGEQALHLVADENMNLRTVISAILSSATLEAGNFDHAESVLRSARQTAYRAGNPFTTFSILMNESALAAMRGQLHRAHDLNMEALQLAEAESLTRLVFLPKLRLGRMHYFWNQLSQARQYITDALEQADANAYPIATVHGHLTLSWIQDAENQYEQAMQTLSAAEKIALKHHETEPIGWVRGVRAKLQLSAGEYEAASRWLKLSGWEAFDLHNESNPIFNDESFFPLCQYLIASKQSHEWERVERLLEWRLKDSEKQKRNSTILKIRLMQVLLYQVQHHTNHAMTALLQALEIAAPENYVRPFLDEECELIPLLKRVPNPYNNFAKQILASASTHQSQALIEPLSRREISIMQLMAQGHTNPEIAHTQMLAVSTVRWYARQIFRKLGVHNRTQAATEARKLNLL